MQFIERLEEWNANDTRVRAVLRRSLAFDPGQFPAAYPYVEPFLNGDDNAWHRSVYYLVAALWAAHWKPCGGGTKLSIGKACAQHMHLSGSASTEKRFIAVIDGDSDQLPYRLRQLIALLKDYPIDFGQLLQDLLYWNSSRKSVQYKWARDFYRSADNQE